MVPLENHNVKVVSMGLFTDGDAPVVWRGPMATKALDRLLFGTDWGPLDALVIDMPPGTGDAQITLGQRLPLSGAVIVSTPQDVALLDARWVDDVVGGGLKAGGGRVRCVNVCVCFGALGMMIKPSVKTRASNTNNKNNKNNSRGAQMFRAVRVPLLGLVANMAAFACPCCGHEEPIFGDDASVARAAEELGADLLGRVPLDPAVRKLSDEGAPVVAAAPASASAAAFFGIAERVWGKLRAMDDAAAAAADGGGGGGGPKITIA